MDVLSCLLRVGVLTENKSTVSCQCNPSVIRILWIGFTHWSPYHGAGWSSWECVGYIWKLVAQQTRRGYAYGTKQALLYGRYRYVRRPWFSQSSSAKIKLKRIRIFMWVYEKDGYMDSQVPPWCWQAAEIRNLGRAWPHEFLYKISDIPTPVLASKPICHDTALIWQATRQRSLFCIGWSRGWQSCQVPYARV